MTAPSDSNDLTAMPGFAQVSPTVYGFDFNAREEAAGFFGAAGVDGSVPSSEAADVVRHSEVVRTGNNAHHGQPSRYDDGMGALMLREQPPQPPEMHTVPGYPWQGHPEIAYSQPFTGPDGTSPMTQGGPNVGAYATAPPLPGTIAGGGYPQAAAGTYEPTRGQPPFGGYSGLDFGGLDSFLAQNTDLGDAAARKARRAQRKAGRQEAANSRVVHGRNGYYVYRQFSDGRIQIMQTADAQALPVGSVLTPDSPRGQAITAEIGTWTSYARTRRLDTVSAVAAGIQKIAGAATGGGGRRKRGGRGKRKRGGAPAPAGAYIAPAAPALPAWAPWAAGGVVLAIIVGVAMKASKDDG